ncbi:MAG: hypothetical protein M1831_006515 [Alyxoria varia]|nr:MAG: hypothetical protein M1831_006515 [Alyxoria varia]
MDHFNLGDALERPTEEVPVLGLVQYDDGDFWTFPERCGYGSQEELRRAVFQVSTVELEPSSSNATLQHALSTLQEWLFFGLLYEFCDLACVDGPRDEFIRVLEGGGKVACTEKLPGIIEMMWLDHADEAISELTGEDIERALKQNTSNANLTSALDKFVQIRSDTGGPSLRKRMKTLTLRDRLLIHNVVCPRKLPTSSNTMDMVSGSLGTVDAWLRNECQTRFTAEQEQMLLSVCCIAETIALAIQCVDMRTAPPSSKLFPSFLIEKSKTVGLCPRKVLATDFMAFRSTVYVASIKQERAAFSGNVHAACTLSECRAYADISNLPRHRLPCDGQCDMIDLGEDGNAAVEQALDSGSYPLCQIHRAVDTGDIQLKVLRHVHRETSYVAISHVWSHGLGNPSRNALPDCQLAFLHSILKQANTPAPEDTMSNPPASPTFWLDTLCVPLKRPYRKLAISRMRSTYTDAASTLVLDNDLLSFHGPPFQRCQRLMLSDWTTRLWTYQEQCLSEPNILIAFADGLVPVETLSSDRFRWDYGASGLVTSMLAAPSSVFEKRLGEREEVERILDIATALHGKGTTRGDDEPICFATLMGVDIYDLPDRPRLTDVFEQLRNSLPQDLIFTPGSRSDIPGFRWAPTSLLIKPPRIYSGHHDPGKLTPWGLRIRKDVAFIHEPIVLDQRRPRFLGILCDEEGEEDDDDDEKRAGSSFTQYIKTAFDEAESERSMYQDIHPMRIERPVIVFEGKWNELGFAFVIEEVASGQVEEKKEDEDGGIFGHFRGLVNVIPGEARKNLKFDFDEDERDTARWRARYRRHIDICVD